MHFSYTALGDSYINGILNNNKNNTTIYIISKYHIFKYLLYLSAVIGESPEK